MTRKNEIIEDLSRLHINEIFKKYDNEEDLFMIMFIILKERKYEYLNNLLVHFPKTEKYDVLKCTILRDYIDLLSPYSIFQIIESVVDDKRKLNLLEKYFKKLESFEIAGIISSLKDDNLKKEKFREYIKHFDSEDFSDYLRKIKNDDIRTSEFSLFKGKYPNYRLDWVASSYSTDEKKMEVFKNNYDESKKKEIPFFIFLLQSDEAKISCLDSYNESIKKEDMWYITSNLKEQNIIIDVIRRYAKKMPGHEICNLLTKIEDENTRYEFLEEYIDFLDEKDILEIIIALLGKEGNLGNVISYLLCKTSNQDTIAKILNAGSTMVYNDNIDSKKNRR